jgi:hypothetical protein
MSTIDNAVKNPRYSYTELKRTDRPKYQFDFVVTGAGGVPVRHAAPRPVLARNRRRRGDAGARGGQRAALDQDALLPDADRRTLVELWLDVQGQAVMRVLAALFGRCQAAPWRGIG